jgi:hypothetical protein
MRRKFGWPCHLEVLRSPVLASHDVARHKLVLDPGLRHQTCFFGSVPLTLSACSYAKQNNAPGIRAAGRQWPLGSTVHMPVMGKTLPDMAMPWILIGIVAGRFGTIAEDEVELRLLAIQSFFPPKL